MSIHTLERPDTTAIPHSPHHHIERLVDHFPELREQIGDRAVWLVREDLHEAGSFKWRGAEHAVNHYWDTGDRKFATASAGNAAIGALLAVARRGGRLTIGVPTSAPPEKSTKLRNYWRAAEQPDDHLTVHIAGESFDDTRQLIQQELEGARYVDPYDDARVIEGQQGVLIDTLRLIPDLGHIAVAVGGGGLLTGSHLAGLEYGVTAWGVEATGSDSLSRTLRAKSDKPLASTAPNTLYGGIAVKFTGDHGLELLAQHRFDPYHLVSATDHDVLELAQHYERRGAIDTLEPTSLVAIAGLRTILERLNGSNDTYPVAVVGSGRNESYKRLLRQHLQK